VQNGLDLGSFLVVISLAVSFLLNIISAVYLRHKIIHVKAYIRELQQSGLAPRKLNRSQRLKELLTEQVKPTIAVFIMGGMDAVCNVLISTTIAFSRVFYTPIVQFRTFQIILVPLLFLQPLSHSLSYGLWNKEIWDEILLAILNTVELLYWTDSNILYGLYWMMYVAGTQYPCTHPLKYVLSLLCIVQLQHH